MPVKIRMKQMGRKHRPFYRIVAIDVRKPRGGRVLEELGTYDPLILDTDARVSLNGERVNYWIGVGAQPTEKVKVFIKKYGAAGTHAANSEAARVKMALPKLVPPPPEVIAQVKPKKSDAPAEDGATEGAPAEEAT